MAIAFVAFACQKQINYGTDIVFLNDQIQAIQKRTDSLTSAMALSNMNQANLSKSIDSIRIQIGIITSQITILNNQINTASANIASINSQIAELNTKLNELLSILNSLIINFNSMPATLNIGLVLHLPFQGNTLDSSGNENHAIVNGAIPSNDRFGKNNSSYRFGTNKTMQINTPTSSLNLSNSFSISSWFILDSLASSFNASMILSKHDGDIGFDGWVYGVWNDSGFPYDFVVFGDNRTNGSYIYSGVDGAIKEKVWYNFIVTYDNESKVFIYYLNGKKIANKILQSQVVTNNYPVTIGYQKSTYSNYLDFFRGSIDEIRIYNRAINAKEVEYLSKQ